MLNEPDAAFIARRRRFAGAWNAVGGVCLALLAGGMVWLYFAVPRLVDPVYVLAEIKAGALTQSDALLMAAMLPVMVLACFLLAVALVLAGYGLFAIERRYQRIVGELLARRTT